MKRAWILVVAAIALARGSEPSSPTAWLGFAPEVTYSSGGNVLGGFTSGDLNNDGWSDLLVVARTQLKVKMLEGLPAAAFKPATEYTAGGDPKRVAVGDVNGDGWLDLLVIGHFDNGFVLRRGAAGGLGTPELYSLPGHGQFVLATDLNGDRLEDVVAVYDGSGQPVRIRIFFGAATGPLVPGDSIDTAYFTSRDLVTGDFNGDRVKDLVVATGDPQAALLFLRGLGSGRFSDPVVIPPLATPNGTTDGTDAVDVADLNHDGRDDVVVGHADFRDLLSVRLGGPQGLGTATEIASGMTRDVALGDVDGDGNADLLAAHADSGQVSLRMGRGDGTFGPPTLLRLGRSPLALVLKDLDGDGSLDLAVTDFGSDNILVLRNRGRN